MTSKGVLGRQWEQPELSWNVYRGINVPRGEKPNLESLGSHWTHSYDVAEAFSTGNPSNIFLQRGNSKKYILHGEVPISSYQGSKEFREKHAIDFNPLEEELPVRTGAPINLTGVTRVTDSSGSTNTRMFKKPKRSKA